jgi:hypothetical protein
MDFIERLFGISPDGGDGSIEAMILGLGVLLAAAAAWYWRSAAKQPAHARQPAMWGTDKEREAVSVTGDAKRPLPHARGTVFGRAEGE